MPKGNYQPVNLLASPSVVRIHHPPPNSTAFAVEFFFYFQGFLALEGSI
jgi:hypothetical protein